MNQNIEFYAHGVEVNGYTLNNYGEVELTESQYDEILNECSQLIHIGDLTFWPNEVVKQCDPIAYDCGKSDYESSLQSDVDDEIDAFIEEVQETLTCLFEADTEQDSDTLWNYFDNVGALLDYHATPDNLCQVSQQIREHLEIEPDEIYQGFTFQQIKEKALETLAQSLELYCHAQVNQSYWVSPDCVLSINIGEFEYQIDDEFEPGLWPDWLIDKVNRSSDFTVNHGFAYFICNGAELILKNPDDFFSDVIEALQDEQTNQEEQLKPYMVLYREDNSMENALSEPLGFTCMAENTDHAEEQCENAYPACDIVWVCIDLDYQTALADYYNIHQNNGE